MGMCASVDVHRQNLVDVAIDKQLKKDEEEDSFTIKLLLLGGIDC
jgi:hypothetical protein